MEESKNQPSSVRRVLIVDDHPLVRMGISQLVKSEKDLEICGEASTRSEALALVDRLCPHIVLVDLTIEGGGIELLKDLKARFPLIATLVITMHSESSFAERALRVGARGYIMKTEVVSDVIFAIRKVLSGEIYLSSKLSLEIIQRMTQTGLKAEYLNPSDVLTDRELQIFEMFGQGMRSSEIAQQLHLSKKTINTHRANIMDKLCIKGSTKLNHKAFHWLNEEANKLQA